VCFDASVDINVNVNVNASMLMRMQALVGYTNAGKTTLLRKLSKDASILSEDRLFATLDPTTRRATLPSGACYTFVTLMSHLSYMFVAIISRVCYDTLPRYACEHRIYVTPSAVGVTYMSHPQLHICNNLSYIYVTPSVTYMSHPQLHKCHTTR
jgi:GTPase SAR1 family protein